MKAQIGVEDVVDGQRYDVKSIMENTVENIAPNASIVIQKAIEIIKNTAL